MRNKQTVTRAARWLIALLVALLVSDVTALAQRSRGNVRSTSHQSVNANRGADVNRNANVDRNANVNRNTNVNQNVNVNRNIDVDRDVDVDVHGGYYGGGCCYHGGWGTAAAVATTAVVTAAVVGSIVHTLPPSCTMVVVNGLSYQQCGSTWYQPQLSGGSTTYVVVNNPR
jgi:hypothetical protein